MSTTNDRFRYARAADYLGVTQQWLRGKVHRKQIPYVRLGKRTVIFERVELDKWIAANRQTPKAG